MSNESGKARQIREQDYRRYFHGRVLDIGCGNDKLQLDWCQVDGWDLPQGDAQFLDGVELASYDGVHSSHCLEHMVDVETTMYHWAAVLKSDGVLYITVPDVLLYEQGVFPSRFNPDHKAMFTLFDVLSPHEKLYTLKRMAEIGRSLNLTLLDAKIEAHGYDFKKLGSGEDQTLGNAMAQVVFVFRKK